MLLSTTTQKRRPIVLGPAMMAMTTMVTDSSTQKIPGCDDGADNDESDPIVDCSDGFDGDSDGWIDADDPDCDIGDSEGGYGSTQCNDGVDNDGNGDIDADDDGCSNAIDDIETYTSDGCSNGYDDEDGWVDQADPDCMTTKGGSGDEDGVLSETECNDLTDNDGDGDIDFADAGCADATDDAEDAGDCEDGDDNDGDGWPDLQDPDCFDNGTTEDGFPKPNAMMVSTTTATWLSTVRMKAASVLTTP